MILVNTPHQNFDNSIKIAAENSYSAGIYLLKVNNRKTTTWCEICSKLTIKTPEHLNGSFFMLRCSKTSLIEKAS